MIAAMLLLLLMMMHRCRATESPGGVRFEEIFGLSLSRHCFPDLAGMLSGDAVVVRGCCATSVTANQFHRRIFQDGKEKHKER